MKLFEPVYDRVMGWSRHRYAPRYLAGLSLVESFVLPFPPPDVMLAPMAAASPARAWYLAALTTIASVIGGVLGYLAGWLAFEWLGPWLRDIGYAAELAQAEDWFATWGVWVVLVAGFSPLPYKLFTITAGALAMAWLPFVLASLLGRGARFFLVALFMAWAGPRAERHLRPYMERIGWAGIGVLAVAIAVYLALE